MSAFTILRSATELVVSAGAGAIVGNVIKNTAIPTAVVATTGIRSTAIVKTLNRVSVVVGGVVGGVVLSNMVGEAAANYATGKLDKAASQVNSVKSAFAEELDKAAEQIHVAADKLDDTK